MGRKSTKAKSLKVNTNTIQPHSDTVAAQVNGAASQAEQQMQTNAGTELIQDEQQAQKLLAEEQDKAGDNMGSLGTSAGELTATDVAPVSEKKTVFVTSDGIGHYNQAYANDYSQKLDDGTITISTDDVFTGTITGIGVQKITDSINAFEKAEDLKVPSAALKYHDK